MAAVTSVGEAPLATSAKRPPGMQQAGADG